MIHNPLRMFDKTARRGVFMHLPGGVKEPPFSLPLTRRPLHNPTKAAHIVILKERRISRELKDLDFPSDLFEEKVLRFAQDDNIAKPMGYAKVSLTRGGGGSKRRWVKPPRNFVAVPLANGDKIGFTLCGVYFHPAVLDVSALPDAQGKNTCASIKEPR